MNHAMNTLHRQNSSGIVLEGGPADLPAELRRRRSLPVDSTIKIPHRGGYEHFVLVDTAPDSAITTPTVFRWIMRTKIAE